MSSHEVSGSRSRRQRTVVGPTIFVVLIITVTSYMVYSALGFARFAARLAPLTFAAATLVLAVIVLVAEITDVRAVRRGRREIADENRPVTDDAVLGAADALLTRKELIAFGWLAFAFANFYLLGFLAGMTLFMVVIMKVNGKESWFVTLGVTAGVMIGVHTMFIRILNVRVYTGVFGDAIPFL